MIKFDQLSEANTSAIHSGVFDPQRIKWSGGFSQLLGVFLIILTAPNCIKLPFKTSEQ